MLLGLVATQSSSVQRGALCRLLHDVDCNHADRGRLRYRHMSGFFPFAYTVHGAAYAPEPDGPPSVRVDRVSVHARPFAYLFGHGLVFDSVHADRVEVDEAPAVRAAGDDARVAAGVAAADMPWPSTATAVHCFELHVERLEMAERALSIHGSGSVQGNWTADLRVYDADTGAESGDVIEMRARGDGGRRWVSVEADWRLPAPLLDDHRLAGSVRLGADWTALTRLSTPGLVLGVPTGTPALTLSASGRLLARPLPRQRARERANGALELSVSGDRSVALAGASLAADAGRVAFSGDIGSLDALDEWPRALHANGRVANASFQADCDASACRGSADGAAGRMSLGDGCLELALDGAVEALRLHVRPGRALPTTFGGLVAWIHGLSAADDTTWSAELQSPIGAVALTVAPQNYSIIRISGDLSAGRLGALEWSSARVRGGGAGIEVELQRPRVQVERHWAGADVLVLRASLDGVQFDGLWPRRADLSGALEVRGDTSGRADVRVGWEAAGGLRLALDAGDVDLGLRRIVWGPDDDVVVEQLADGVWRGRARLWLAGSAGPWLNVDGRDGDVDVELFERLEDVLALVQFYTLLEPDDLLSRVWLHLPTFDGEGVLHLSARRLRSAPALVLSLANATVQLLDWGAEYRNVAAEVRWPEQNGGLTALYGERGTLSILGDWRWTLGRWDEPLSADVAVQWTGADGADDVDARHVWRHRWQ